MILFLDDEPARMEVYARDLVMSGHEIHFENNVDDALATIKENPNLISLLILDLMLPPGKSFADENTHEGLRTGINFFNRVRKIVANLPTIILTNVSDEKVEDWFQKQENCWFFQKKNFFPFELTEEINMILNN